MSSLVSLPGVKDNVKNWDFTSVPGFPGGFALALAEYAFARLYPPSSLCPKAVKWLTVHNQLNTLKAFAEYCSKLGLRGFHQVNQRVLTEYLRELQHGQRKKSKSRILVIIRDIYRIWDYRHFISEPMHELPFGRTYKKLFGKAPSYSENSTPVIPEPVYGAVMSAALKYVQDYSSTIIQTWNYLIAFWKTEVAIPCNQGQKGKKRANKNLLKEVKSILACTACPWRRQQWIGLADLLSELQQLRTACTLIILAYSGIRLSELLSLEANSYVSDTCEDGLMRYFINTTVHKHRASGSKDTWVVIDEVVQAIRLLEQLSARQRSSSKDDRLFIHDPKIPYFSIRADFENAKLVWYTNEAIGLQLDSFQSHCNKNILDVAIPEWVDDSGTSRSWKFNARQFRRTLARYIARQPFGIIAGMLQYKQVEVAVFQGYAGTEPAWNKLLEEERVLASVDILEEIAMDLSNGDVAGGVGENLKQSFASEFRGRAEDYPPSQIAKWLARGKKPLFVGKFNFCFFDPTRARCTGGLEVAAPVLNHCQPGTCDNACVGKRHIGKWEAQLAQAEEIVLHPKTSPHFAGVMKREATILRRIVSEYGNKK